LNQWKHPSLCSLAQLVQITPPSAQPLRFEASPILELSSYHVGVVASRFIPSILPEGGEDQPLAVQGYPSHI
jgi:hypothetical protein